MSSEQVIQQRIRAAINLHADARLWRNNVGKYKNGASWISYGLAVGSSDLVGLCAPSGRMVCVEVKTPTGKIRPEQLAWVETVRRFGGVAGIARSVEDAEELIYEALQEDITRAVAVLSKLAPELLKVTTIT